MKLASFTIENYRSIISRNKIILDNYSVFVGPNNEGKSNILNALVLTLKIVSKFSSIKFYQARSRRSYRFRSRDSGYDWDTDFPIPLQADYPDGKSVFMLELQFTEAEMDSFRDEIKSNLNGTLPIEISIGKEDPTFRIRKRGPGASTLSQKAQQIANFIGQRLTFQYIPAVRTAESAQSIVDDMVINSLSALESDPNYRTALGAIEKIQKPILDALSAKIKKTLSDFMPAVSDVDLKLVKDAKYGFSRPYCQIIINDGSATLLESKGDGVQSLAALSLMRYESEQGAMGKHYILAIEEPESHLHPDAIHRLKDVLLEIAGNYQIIITTHSPVFIDRQNAHANLIVEAHNVRHAQSINEIRDILGVHSADNLRNADIVLICEGEDDKKSLNALLSLNSSIIHNSIQNGKLCIESLLGGSNLSYKIDQVRNALCSFHCYLDYDECAITAVDVAKAKRLLTDNQITFTICEGMKESEIEDIYDMTLYEKMIQNDYGVDINSKLFRNNKHKWSSRMQELFKHDGKQWNDKIEKDIKDKISDLVGQTGLTSLNVHKRSSLDSLIKELEKKLEKKSWA